MTKVRINGFYLDTDKEIDANIYKFINQHHLKPSALLKEGVVKMMEQERLKDVEMNSQKEL